uniref:Ran-binding protein 3 n=1 Tax=Pygocentrus nattereri TaxID=42514 RepID=A0AAR2M4L9_PYGNA
MIYSPFIFADKPDIAAPVLVLQKDRAQKRSADGSGAEDGEDSDQDDSSYCPPAKRENFSKSFTHFPPSNSVSKNNVFMPSNFSQSPTGNSDSEPEEKVVGFRLRPPTLIHGQAPSAGVPSQKPKERQRSVLRPAVLQAPPSRPFSPCSECIKIMQCHEKVFFPNMFVFFSTQKADDCSDTSTKFVFGQNMSDRVLSPLKCSKVAAEGSVGSEAESLASEPCSSQDVNSEKDANTTESLEESAAAYTKATAKKCLLEKVEVRTGEESESNVLQIQCKLFVFEKSSQSWVERGCGLLRLNDMSSTDIHNGTLQSRLVMRTQGSLRLILNTKLWAQMQVDKASEKSIRITAMDTEDLGIKVFLISASSKDSGQLFAALHHRILALRSHAEQELEPQPTLPEGEASRSSDEDDSHAAPITAASAPVSGNACNIKLAVFQTTYVDTIL